MHYPTSCHKKVKQSKKIYIKQTGDECKILVFQSSEYGYQFTENLVHGCVQCVLNQLNWRIVL